MHVLDMSLSLTHEKTGRVNDIDDIPKLRVHFVFAGHEYCMKLYILLVVCGVVHLRHIQSTSYDIAWILYIRDCQYSFSRPNSAWRSFTSDLLDYNAYKVTNCSMQQLHALSCDEYLACLLLF